MDTKHTAGPEPANEKPILLSRTCADCQRPSAGTRQVGRRGSRGWSIGAACIEHRTHDEHGRKIDESGDTHPIPIAANDPPPRRSLRKLGLVAVALASVCGAGCSEGVWPEGEDDIPSKGARVRPEALDDTGSDGSEGSTTSHADSSEGCGGDSTTGEASDGSTSSEASSEGSSTGGELPTSCEDSIEHVPCDAGSLDPLQAFGLGCAGELAINGAASGHAGAIGTRSSFGGTATFNPREGSAYAVIGSGLVSELGIATPPGDSPAWPTHCNDDLGAFDPGQTLPAPLAVDDPTLAAAFDAGAYARDYTEIRFSAQVPEAVTAFSYDFAFATTEYPYFLGSIYSDVFVAWLESEQWTGNAAFDAGGNPISLEAGFLEYTGNDAELSGTCMGQHAATGWLTTTAGVTPGESITLAFAIFDMGDSALDSFAFLDNFAWSCDPAGAPTTGEA